MPRIAAPSDSAPLWRWLAQVSSRVKQLVQICCSSGSAEPRIFVERRLRAEDGMRLVAAALVAGDGAAHLFNELVRDLRSRSLQSVEELLRVAAYFDIPSAEWLPDPSPLREVFTVRNQIAHELDVLHAPGGHRRQRDADRMVAATQILLTTAARFLGLVDERIAQVRS